MSEHAVVIAGDGPTGMMPAAEPVLGVVIPHTAVLIRPDGYVAWVADGTDTGLPEALSTWFGPPAAVVASIVSPGNSE